RGSRQSRAVVTHGMELRKAWSEDGLATVSFQEVEASKTGRTDVPDPHGEESEDHGKWMMAKGKMWWVAVGWPGPPGPGRAATRMEPNRVRGPKPVPCHIRLPPMLLLCSARTRSVSILVAARPARCCAHGRATRHPRMSAGRLTAGLPRVARHCRPG